VKWHGGREVRRWARVEERWCCSGAEVKEEKLEVELVLVGEVVGLVFAVEEKELSACSGGRSSSRCCRRDSCFSRRSRYFCNARSLL